MIQDLIVILLVALAAVYLGRYLWRSVRNMLSKKSDGGCPACGDCAFAPTESMQAAAPKINFISIDQIRIN